MSALSVMYLLALLCYPLILLNLILHMVLTCPFSHIAGSFYDLCSWQAPCTRQASTGKEQGGTNIPGISTGNKEMDVGKGQKGNGCQNSWFEEGWDGKWEGDWRGREKLLQAKNIAVEYAKALWEESGKVSECVHKRKNAISSMLQPCWHSFSSFLIVPKVELQSLTVKTSCFVSDLRHSDIVLSLV